MCLIQIQFPSRYAVQGMYLGFFFGLNHFAEERMTDRSMSWPRIQTNTAVNWGCGSWFAAVASGFLNMQIEHHYFPQCPAFAYVAVQREVEKYCEEKGFRYVKFSFMEATAHMFQGMIDCAKTEIARRREKKNA
jgi:fatty acid desaturase